MRISVESRAVELGEYIVKSGATVRSAAKKFGISKSTVHTVVTKWNGSAGGWNDISSPMPTISYKQQTTA